jgi:N-acetylneuraminic acid mutarotase
LSAFRRISMFTKYSVLRLFVALFIILMISSTASASPQLAPNGTGFTYQGKLIDGGVPANGTYDLQFKLFDAPSSGAQVGGTLTQLGVTVTNGLFTVQLDFGAVFNGTALYLEIGVAPGGSSGPYTTLTPRQPLSPTPYALFAANSAMAANSDKLDGLHAADIPAHGSILLGAPGDARLSGYQSLGLSNVECNGCDGFSGTWTKKLQFRGAPSARLGQSVVWTGSEMIVWGGYNGSNEVNDGYRYNPSTDTWGQIAASPLAIRSKHTAVWTGSEMIVWGGKNGNTYYSDGARYNPATNTWATMSTASGPLGRAYHAAVWTGKYMVITGGSDATPTYFADIYGYNPVTDTWEFHGGTGYPGRDLATMVWSGDNVIVFGGHNASGAVAGGFMFSPITFGYTTLPVLSLAQRYNHSAVWTGTDMIVWGGYSGSNDTNNGYSYNEASNKWTALSASPLAVRDSHAAVWTGSEMIVWGGRTGSTYYNDGARYNPATNTWTMMADGSSLLTGRSLPSMVWTDNRLLVWGGGNAPSSPLGDGALYNLFLGLYRNP